MSGAAGDDGQVRAQQLHPQLGASRIGQTEIYTDHIFPGPTRILLLKGATNAIREWIEAQRADRPAQRDCPAEATDQSLVDCYSGWIFSAWGLWGPG